MPPEMVHLLVDGHVHLYPFMSPRLLLDAAGENFCRSAGSPAGRASPQGLTGLLLVADPAGINGFDRLAGFLVGLKGDSADPYWSREYADSGYVVFRRPDGLRIAAIKGRQLVTREGLEVLAIGGDDEDPERPLHATVDRIGEAGGVSIIPWGAGKWSGRRGRLVTQLASEQRRDVLLADNGARPWCWNRVPQFDAAAKTGMKIIAGTDPLPIRGEELRAGSYGFHASVTSGQNQEFVEAFCKELKSPAASLPLFGTRMTLSRFAASQVRLRLQRQAAGRR